MNSLRPHSPNTLTVLAFGMLMGAFTVGLWVWLLEPGGYRQKHPVADNEEVDGAYFSKEDFDHSLKSSPSLFEEDEKDRSTENRSIRSLQATLAVPEANEKSSAPVLHKQPASKPSAYDSGDVLWSGRRLHVEAWAILPQAANHLPPPDLMTEFWSRAVVTQYGGVVLLGSGHFATWDFETPGKVRTAADSGRHFKACFDTFGSSGSRYPAPCLGDQRQEPSCASADTRWLWRSVLLRQGRRSTRQPPERRTHDPDLGHPKRHRLISSPPGAGAMNAVLTEDGSVWVTSKGLWKLAPGAVSWEKISDAEGSLSAMGDGVIVLDHGSFKSEGNAEQPPFLPQVEVMRTVTGIGASLHDDANITVWGSLLKGETRLFRTLLSPNQIALGPSGLLVAW